MLAFKIITTILDAIFMLLIVGMKKETVAVSTVSLLILVIMAINLSFVWN
jgi:hypothetical protein